jgi:hypothetical protein
MRLALVFMIFTAPVHAHHSIAGIYDNQRAVSIDGVVTQFQFVSPHPYLDLRDARTSQTWRFEMDNRGELSSIGMTQDTFKTGDRLLVTGRPARREPNRAYVERLQRPADGYGYEQVGSSPRRIAATRWPVGRGQ